MHRLAIAFAALALANSSMACDERVPVAELIAHPEAYQGKAVWVVATVSFGLENMSACPPGEDRDIRRCLWIDIHDGPYESSKFPLYEARREALSRFNRQTVAIHATFDRNLDGHFGMYPGGLGGLAEISGHHDAWSFATDSAVPRNACAGALPPETSSQKLDRGDYDGAIAEHTRAIARDPHDPWIYLQRAQARAMKQDIAGAMDDYSLAMAVGSSLDDSIILVFRAATKARTGDPDGAIADYTRAIEIDPDIPRAHRERGLLRQAKGDHAGAAADFDHDARLQRGD